MKTAFLFAFIGCLFFTTSAQTSSNVSSISGENKKGLFESDEILNITLSGSFHQIINDRSGEPKYFPVDLLYKADNNTETSIPIKVKTRGHFRREKGNCTFPPLLLTFPEHNSSSVFPEKSSLKLVMPCQGEEFIVHEWLVYKLYNLITPQSFRARLVRVTLIDSKNKKMPSPFYGIILEDEKQMARRNNMAIEKKKIRPQQTMQQPFLRMAVFEYLIGNTDWSVDYLQNIKLIAPDSTCGTNCCSL